MFPSSRVRSLMVATLDIPASTKLPALGIKFRGLETILCELGPQFREIGTGRRYLRRGDVVTPIEEQQ